MRRRGATAMTTDLRRRFQLLLAQDDLDLPMLPMVASQVTSLCADEDTDAAKLSQVLHQDQALAGNVLRVANSPMYAGQVPIVSLQQAVSRLGMMQVSEIAMAVSVRNRVFRSKAHAELLRNLWSHSVLAGYFTKEVSRMRRRNVEIAFVCGLLHDVGKAILIATLEERKEDPRFANYAELLAALHDFHCQVGSRLVSAWKLPEQLHEAIVYHHAFDLAPSYGEMAAMTCLGDLLSHLALPVPGQTVVDKDALRRHEVIVALNLHSDQMDELIAKQDSALRFMEAIG